MFKIGEALIGAGNEVAHIDLIIGEKDGPVGKAFADGFTNLSTGHTPLLSVIRPNLLSKPCTLIIPKTTIKDLSQANKVFGPAQAAVAKAVADSVEEGIISKDKVDEWVILCGVFIHPEAKDYRKIFQYNYGATKLAIMRALKDYPNLEKILDEKDRAIHPVVGFRMPRLWQPPYLQIALDNPNIEELKSIIKAIPKSDRIIFEAGTPLIKKYGVDVIREIRSQIGNAFIVADLKTLDVGQVEVDIAFEQTADAVCVSGLAPKETIEKFVDEAEKCGIYTFLDTANVEKPLQLLKSLEHIPEVVILHRSIDAEHRMKHSWGLVKEVKKTYAKTLVAVAGGISPENIKDILKEGADIIIVGRYITQSKDVENAAREFLRNLGGDIDLFRIHYATE